MSDYVIRLIPYEPFEVDYIEAWLNEMAAKGLVLVSTTLFVARFKKTNGYHARFRLVFTGGIQSIHGNLYLQQKGWEYVTTLSHLYDIYMIEPPLLPNYESEDPAARTFIRLKDFAFSIVVFLILFVLSFEFMDGINRQGGPLHYILTDSPKDGDLILLLSLLLLAILPFAALIAFMCRMRRSSLELGTEEVLHPYKRRFLVKTIPMLLILLCLIPTFFVFQRSVLFSPEESAASIPLPLLAEINAEEGQALQALNQLDPLLRTPIRDHVIKEHRILAPVIIRITQYGPRIQIDDSTYRDSYNYQVDDYHLLNRKLAESYTKEQLALWNQSQCIRDDKDLSVWYANTKEDQTLLLQYQNRVVVVCYHGATNLRDCIPLYEEFLGIQKT